MQFDVEKFAARLRGKRAELKYSIKQLSDASGVSEASIQCYENGSTTPLLGTAAKLARALGCDVNYLSGWND